MRRPSIESVCSQMMLGRRAADEACCAHRDPSRPRKRKTHRMSFLRLHVPAYKPYPLLSPFWILKNNTALHFISMSLVADYGSDNGSDDESPAVESSPAPPVAKSAISSLLGSLPAPKVGSSAAKSTPVPKKLTAKQAALLEKRKKLFSLPTVDAV